MVPPSHPSPAKSESSVQTLEWTEEVIWHRTCAHGHGQRFEHPTTPSSLRHIHKVLQISAEKKANPFEFQYVVVVYVNIKYCSNERH